MFAVWLRTSLADFLSNTFFSFSCWAVIRNGHTERNVVVESFKFFCFSRYRFLDSEFLRNWCDRMRYLETYVFLCLRDGET
jgi:hypothetical protein